MHGIGLDDGAARLIRKQVHGVGSVVPQQVVGPATGLAQRIHVGAAEKVGLHIHLLDVELTGFNLLVHPLVAGVKATGVAHHGDQTGLLLQLGHFLRILQGVSKRNFNLHMLAGLQAGNGLLGVHLRGRAQNDGIDFRQRQRISQVGADMLDAVLVSHFLGLIQTTPDQRDDFHAVDVLDAVQVLDAEGTRASQRDFDGLAHY